VQWLKLSFVSASQVVTKMRTQTPRLKEKKSEGKPTMLEKGNNRFLFCLAYLE
jgi:hypothetical protein